MGDKEGVKVKAKMSVEGVMEGILKVYPNK